MENAMREKDRGDRVMRALEIASVSGFMVSLHGIQAACLGLCNACRECAPVHRLTMSRRGPPAFLSMLCPGRFPVTDSLSRVVRIRKVLKVEIRDRRWSPAAAIRSGQVEEADEADLEPADIPLVHVRWPAGTKEIHLPFLEEGIDRVTWPVGLEVLSFFLPRRGRRGRYMWPAKGLFNSPLDSARFPSGLREIFMGDAFNQSIEGVAWPQGLERLSLPGFNQSIQGVQWPAGLKSLEFMPPSELLLREDFSVNMESLEFDSGVFNQPLGSALPASLETLWLSDDFNQSLKDITWPSRLVTLGFGFALSSWRFEEASWPPGLRKLCMATEVENPRAPSGCEVVYFLREGDLTESDHYGCADSIANSESEPVSDSMAEDQDLESDGDVHPFDRGCGYW